MSIKIENVEVIGWEHAIRGMRNPMNSWEKSDSGEAVNCAECGKIEREGACWADYRNCVGFECYEIGPNDHKLMMSLAKGGPVHAKYRRMIVVYADITAPLYWWKEFDTYRIGVEKNSCSTMHKIHEKEFTLEDFSCEHLTDGSINLLKNIICELNRYRMFYHRYDEMDNKNFMNGPITCKKDLWWQMIQLLPNSYNQMRTVKLNYEVLARMYKSRKAHKLDEWREFCKWIEQLPYSELITGEAVNDANSVCVGEPKTEVAYLCDGEQCNSCNNIDCNHTLDIKHAVNFEKVGDHKYMEVEHSPLAHPETYVSDAIAMIGDMTDAQRVELWKHLFGNDHWTQTGGKDNGTD